MMPPIELPTSAVFSRPSAFMNSVTWTGPVKTLSCTASDWPQPMTSMANT
jgi:hypothetical protein